MILKENLPGNFGVFGFLAGTLADDKLERKALDLLWNNATKQKLLALAGQVMSQYGIVMELEDIELVKDDTEPVETVDTEPNLQFTDEMENYLLEALSGYLKDTLNND